MNGAVTPARREAALSRLRSAKMARSAHAYVRGSATKFYEWLASASGRAIPHGPSVWICGDCHLGNLGPVSDVDGDVGIHVRDLDQTVVGNPAHDLVRLGLSLAMAARGSDLPGITTDSMLDQLLDGYRLALLRPGDRKHAKVPDVVQTALRQSHRRTRRQLEDDWLSGHKHLSIPIGERFWSLTARERRQLERLFLSQDVQNLVACLRPRDGDTTVKLLDAAYWVKGCSSLGRLRFAALVRIGKREHADICLVDVKQAAHSSAPHYKGASMPKEDGRRVVTGARQLTPWLGDRMLATSVMGQSVVMRELRPQDLKLEIEHISRDQAVVAARFLGGVLGRSHASQLDSEARRSWAAELVRAKSKRADAPTWLWDKVVELCADHEVAYLEHCRRFSSMNRVGG